MTEDAYDTMLEEFLLADIDPNETQIPVDAVRIKSTPAGNLWRTVDNRFIIEYKDLVDGGDSPDDEDDEGEEELKPIPDRDDDANDWPPPTPPDEKPDKEKKKKNKPSDPRCKKCVNLKLNGAMARMERIKASDDFYLGSKGWPTGSSTLRKADMNDLLEPSKQKTLGVWLEEEPLRLWTTDELNMSVERGGGVPDSKLTREYSKIDINTDGSRDVSQLWPIPMAGHDTAIANYTITEMSREPALKGRRDGQDAIENINPPPGSTIYRASDGQLYLWFDRPMKGSVEIDIFVKGPPSKANSKNLNFDYILAKQDTTKIDDIIYAKHPNNGLDCLATTAISGFSLGGKPQKRAIYGRIPTMDKDCLDAAKKILWNDIWRFTLLGWEAYNSGNKTYGAKGKREAARRKEFVKAFSTILLETNGPMPENVDDLIERIRKECLIGDLIAAIQIYGASFICNGIADTVVNSAANKAGACEQRARVAVIVLNALGLPTRFITNTCHAYIEVWVPSMQTWVDLDLNGCDPGGDRDSSKDNSHEPDTPDFEDEEEKEMDDQEEDSDDEDVDDEGDDEGDDDGDDDGDGDSEGDDESDDGGDGDDDGVGSVNIEDEVWTAFINELMGQGYNESDAIRITGVAQSWDGFN